MSQRSSKQSAGSRNEGETVIPMDVRQSDIDRARRHIASKLRATILEPSGDFGSISACVNDLMALDRIVPTKVDDYVPPPKAPTRAEHDEQIRRLSKRVAEKERARAVLTEVKGLSDEEAARAMP